MPRVVSLSRFMPYGAPDLIASAPDRLTRALALSSGLAILAFMLGGVFPKPAPPGLGVTLCCPPPHGTILEPEPKFTNGGGKITHPHDGVIQPVHNAPNKPFDLKPPDPDFDGMYEDGQAVTPPGEIGPPGRVTQEPERLPDRHEFIYTEEPPEPITIVKPEYPEVAREALIDGLVVVHVLVGRNGYVLRAEADERLTVPMLEHVAVDAARRWVFKPAYASGRPVAVWTTIPFHFRLHE